VRANVRVCDRLTLALPLWVTVCQAARWAHAVVSHGVPQVLTQAQAFQPTGNLQAPSDGGNIAQASVDQGSPAKAAAQAALGGRITIMVTAGLLPAATPQPLPLLTEAAAFADTAAELQVTLMPPYSLPGQWPAPVGTSVETQMTICLHLYLPATTALHPGSTPALQA
jgi:hypothetical protein